jgi:hypothetical protein
MSELHDELQKLTQRVFVLEEDQQTMIDELKQLSAQVQSAQLNVPKVSVVLSMQPTGEADIVDKLANPASDCVSDPRSALRNDMLVMKLARR